MRNALPIILLILLAACGESLSSEQYLARAQQHVDESDYEAALADVKSALQLDIHLGEARCLLGKIYLDTGEWVEAEKELIRAQEDGCEPAVAIPILAEVYLSQEKPAKVLHLDSTSLGDTAAAQLLATQALGAHYAEQPEMANDLVAMSQRRDPDSMFAQLTAARLLALQGDLPGAIVALNKVLLVEPKNKAAWRLKGHFLWQMDAYREARSAFDKTIMDSSVKLADYIARALISIELADYNAAHADAKKLALLAPGHPGTNYIQGLLLFHAKNFRDAMTSFSRAEDSAQEYPELLLYLSVAQLIDGNPIVAENLAVQFLSLQPDSIMGRKLLAILRLKKNRPKEVKELLQPILDFNPMDVGALYILANAYLIDDQSDLGLKLFDRISKLERDVPLEQLSLAHGLLTSQIGSAADQALRDTIAKEPEFPFPEILQILDHLQNERFDEAIGAATSYKWRDLSGIAPYVVLGNVQRAAGNNDEARELYEQALTREPGNPSASLALATMAMWEKEADVERELYRAVLRVNLNHLPTLLNMSAWEGRDDDRPRMASTLQQAIDSHPEAMEPRLRLARILIEDDRAHRVSALLAPLSDLQKRSSRVLDLQFEVAKLTGDKEGAAQYANLAFLQKRTSKKLMALVSSLKTAGRREEAQLYLEGWLRRFPDDSGARMALAQEFLVKNNFGKAAEHYEKALEVEPDNLFALANLAWIIRRDRSAQAVVYMRRAVELESNNAGMLDKLARIEHLNGEDAAALESIKRAIALSGLNFSYRYHRAVIEAALGDEDAAVSTLQRVLRAKKAKFPERAEAEELLQSLQTAPY
ncbi:MAG: putative PEP-CTERM system TPR-repeat lipoprotein [Halioglobus sp.]|jgi:putative PEP-CTERM system TPR-repeat lipoprotein